MQDQLDPLQSLTQVAHFQCTHTLHTLLLEALHYCLFHKQLLPSQNAGFLQKFRFYCGLTKLYFAATLCTYSNHITTLVGLLSQHIMHNYTTICKLHYSYL